jgi:hypothetical protein
MPNYEIICNSMKKELQKMKHYIATFSDPAEYNSKVQLLDSCMKYIKIHKLQHSPSMEKMLNAIDKYVVENNFDIARDVHLRNLSYTVANCLEEKCPR